MKTSIKDDIIIEESDEKIINIFKAIIQNEEKKNSIGEVEISKELLELINEGIDDAEKGNLIENDIVHQNALKLCMK